MSVNGFKFNNTVHKYNYGSLDNIPENFAPEYANNTAYAVGDYCTHDHILYRCTTQIAGEAWNASHWTSVDIAVELQNEVSDLKSEIEEIEPGLSDGAKVALLNCFQHVAWIDEHGQTYYDALESALYADQYPKITALFNPGLNVIYTDDTLDSLKQYLTVKYFETEESTGTVIASANYNLSGTLVEGTSTVLVSYSGLTTSFVINEVVDFYNIWDWSLSNGDFTKLVAGTDRDSSALTGIYISLAETRPAVQYRRNISVPRGIIPFTDYVSHELSAWYPIPVPKTANKITVAVTPNTQYSFINLVHYKSEQNKYGGAAENIGGWTQGNNVKTFTASENLFVSINFKYDSAGQSYPTEPSNITVKFEEV